MSTATITEHPILFTGEMVRAVLGGSKTQTRRVVKLDDFGVSDTLGYDWRYRDKRMLWNEVTHCHLMARCPYGQPGERLWVRETWASFTDDQSGACVVYKADNEARAMLCDCSGEGDPCGIGNRVEIAKMLEFAPIQKWKPSIHMPRWASRITLRVTDVRLERLQDIGEEDARAEGVDDWWKAHRDNASVGKEVRMRCAYQRMSWSIAAFSVLWDSINAKRDDGRYTWDMNPWVWVIEFKRVEE